MNIMTDMRRADCAMTLEEIVAFVQTCDVLRMGMSDEGAYHAPYIVPVNFGCVYDDGDGRLTFYVHCANEGRKLTLLRRNPRVCVELDELVAIKHGKEAINTTTLYRSVIGYGDVCFVTDATERVDALTRISRRYGVEGDIHDTPNVCVLRIDVTEISGKQNKG